MEPIPYYYDGVNRNAVTVKPNKFFFEWLNDVEPEFPVEQTKEGTIYLVPEKNTIEETEIWLKRNFDKIFINELNDWHTAENDWPKKRDHDLFRKWFDVEIYDVILDIEETKIIKG